jgi:hypothetical protein
MARKTTRKNTRKIVRKNPVPAKAGSAAETSPRRRGSVVPAKYRQRYEDGSSGDDLALRLGTGKTCWHRRCYPTVSKRSRYKSTFPWAVGY